VAGCVSAPEGSSEAKAPPAALGLTLDESLRTYMGPNPQTWDNNGVKDEKDTLVYFLDSLQFEAFKAEIDAMDEYYEAESWSENDRDWDRGKTYARWVVRPDGRYELSLIKEDNSVDGYRYEKKFLK
jgi:hypothetical protein